MTLRGLSFQELTVEREVIYPPPYQPPPTPPTEPEADPAPVDDAPASQADSQSEDKDKEQAESDKKSEGQTWLCGSLSSTRPTCTKHLNLRHTLSLNLPLANIV